MGDLLIISFLNCIKISPKQAWWPFINFAWVKPMYFRKYFSRFSRKSHYFCILDVSHLKLGLCWGLHGRLCYSLKNTYQMYCSKWDFTFFLLKLLGIFLFDFISFYFLHKCDIFVCKWCKYNGHFSQHCGYWRAGATRASVTTVLTKYALMHYQIHELTIILSWNFKYNSGVTDI